MDGRMKVEKGVEVEVGVRSDGFRRKDIVLETPELQKDTVGNIGLKGLRSLH